MIIRSQDKKALTNFTQVTDLGVVVKEKECEINVYYPFSINEECSRMCLGTYSTEEKAIKVLDMIQQEFGRHFYGQGGQMATADTYIQPFAFIPPKVFQMPSDEEVEVQNEKEN